jgi:UPF0755 protein
MVRRRRTSRKKQGPGAGSIFLGLLFLIALAAAAAAYMLYAPAGPNQETFVEIAPGSTSSQIAVQLERAGIVRSRYGFDVVRLWKRGRLKAGEYRFDHAAPVTEVYARIARGDVYTIPLTIPEGSTRFDIAARVEQAGFTSKEDFLAATLRDTSLIADIDPTAHSLEGYLFPDTYRFPRKASPTQIVTTMVHRFRSVATQIGILHPGATPETESIARPNWPIHSVITLASLVERETAVKAERPLVASVLTNRLAKDMALMTDPAVIYGLELEGRWRGAIYQSDLARDTPYNTYKHAGLPPGPIANPGQPSLQAAFKPAQTDYLYFVAAGSDPQGKSRFAATLEEHNKNVAAYRQAVGLSPIKAAAATPVAPAKPAQKSSSKNRKPRR